MFRSMLVWPGRERRIALARRTPPFPLNRTGFGIVRFEEPGIVQVVSADAHKNVVSDYNGSCGRRVVELRIGDLNLPLLLAGLSIQADEMAIRTLEVQPIAPHANPTISDGAASIWRVLIMPKFAPGPDICRPDIVGRSEIKNIVDKQRSRLDLYTGRSVGAGDSGSPGEREIADVVRGDLFQLAEPAARVIAVVSRPCVRRLLQQRGRIEFLSESKSADGWGEAE